MKHGQALPVETRAYIKGAMRAVTEICAKKKGVVLVALSKLSPIQPPMAAEGYIKA